LKSTLEGFNKANPGLFHRCKGTWLHA
jgi:hypothetical protein